MIDHTGVNVSDQDAARAFDSNALEPLGHPRVRAGPVPRVRGERRTEVGAVRRDPVGGGHVAFRCPNCASVDAFDAAALAAVDRTTEHPACVRL